MGIIIGINAVIFILALAISQIFKNNSFLRIVATVVIIGLAVFWACQIVNLVIQDGISLREARANGFLTN